MKQKFFAIAVMMLTLIFSSVTFAGYWKVADNQVPAYRDSNLTQRTGNEAVFKGDRIYVHQETDRAYEVSYPVGNTGKYKKRWVSKSVFNRTDVSQKPTNPMIQPVSRYNYPQISGDYYLVPDNSSNHAIDVPNNSHNEGTFLQIYWKNNSAAQVFTIQNVGGQWHIIKHKDSGLVINCYYGGNGNGNKVWLYRDDGTPAGHWRFRDLGNGIYNIESQLSGNPFLEVQSNNSFNGAVVQLWQQHTGQAARWKLVKVTNAPSPSGNGLLYPLKGNLTVTGSSSSTNGFKCDYVTGGSVPIYAPSKGKVEFRQSYATRFNKLASYGNNLRFYSADGQYQIRLAHLTSFVGCRNELHFTESLPFPCGQSNSKKGPFSTDVIDTIDVNQGDLIGYSGVTGNASGHHVHIEVYKKQNGKWQAVDPKSVFTTW